MTGTQLLSVGTIFNLAQRSKSAHRSMLVQLGQLFEHDHQQAFHDFMECFKRILIVTKVRIRSPRDPRE